MRNNVQKYYPFEIKVNTNIAGSSGVGKFTLLTSISGVGAKYRYYVDWGDGSISATTSTSPLTHTYSTVGVYNVKVYGRFDSLFCDIDADGDKIIDVISWGNIKWRFLANTFYGCNNLTGMTTTPPILEKMTHFYGSSNMFYDTSFNQNMGSWDTKNITSFNNMFGNATIFNNGGSPSISGWTTTNATSMSSMFYAANLFNQPIGSWNVSGVTDMSNMLNTTNISVTNYNDILTGWTGWNGITATKSVQPNVVFGASGRNYSSGSTASDARNYLVTVKGWVITDAGGI